MIESWSPVALAKLSLIIMFIPAGLTVIVVIVSILLDLFSKFTGIKKDSVTSIQLNKTDSRILYIVYLSIIIMNVAAIGLFVSGIWAVVDYFINLFV